jgi:hypothetical protein
MCVHISEKWSNLLSSLVYIVPMCKHTYVCQGFVVYLVVFAWYLRRRRCELWVAIFLGNRVVVRVTRLGEFSPLVRLFTYFGQFNFKLMYICVYLCSFIFELPLSQKKGMYSIWLKNGVGYILAIFHTCTCGHPGVV